MTMTYEWEPGMGEISGFGGRYETCCRVALRAALQWLAENPGPPVVFKSLPGIYGIVRGDDRGEQCLGAANDAAIARFGENAGLSGAMLHAVANHVAFIQAQGWDAYVVKMQERKAGDA